jgi:thymidylate synthase (FAD)
MNKEYLKNFITLRVTVPALERYMTDAIPVLDHGFVRVVDYMGDDSAVVQAARVSYGRGTKKVQEDVGLIRYLMRHRHSTPFEMCVLKIHVKLPIFVARQWIRHRTASVNEYSARYSILDREFYVPDPAQIAVQSTQNHQGRASSVTGKEAAYVLDILRRDATQVYDDYTLLLNRAEDGGVVDPSRQGIARELARMNLTLNYYTQWYWKIDVHNLLHFMHLRADPHAQWEIQVYAQALMSIVQAWMPVTYAAFEDYRLGAATLSKQALAVVQTWLRQGQCPPMETSGMSPREWRELMALLGG